MVDGELDDLLSAFLELERDARGFETSQRLVNFLLQESAERNRDRGDLNLEAT
jgi:hypothetical protein